MAPPGGLESATWSAYHPDVAQVSYQESSSPTTSLHQWYVSWQRVHLYLGECSDPEGLWSKRAHLWRWRGGKVAMGEGVTWGGISQSKPMGRAGGVYHIPTLCKPPSNLKGKAFRCVRGYQSHTVLVIHIWHSSTSSMVNKSLLEESVTLWEDLSEGFGVGPPVLVGDPPPPTHPHSFLGLTPGKHGYLSLSDTKLYFMNMYPDEEHHRSKHVDCTYPQIIKQQSN